MNGNISTETADTQLTIGGMTFCEQQTVLPWGAPTGVPVEEWQQAVIARIEGHLDAATALLLALDACEPDPDLEDNGDFEPTNAGSLCRMVNGIPLDDVEEDIAENDSGQLIEGGGYHL